MTTRDSHVASNMGSNMGRRRAMGRGRMGQGKARCKSGVTDIVGEDDVVRVGGCLAEEALKRELRCPGGVQELVRVHM